MFLDQLQSAGAMPALELTMRFAGQRQRLIAHNVANLETPNFQPLDVDPRHFQAMLGEAIADRRSRNGGGHGALRWKSTGQIERSGRGGLTLRPGTSSGNILFHDRNNRDLERTMQDMVENAAVFRTAADLLRSRTDMLRQVISERVT